MTPKGEFQSNSLLTNATVLLNSPDSPLVYIFFKYRSKNFYILTLREYSIEAGLISIGIDFLPMTTLIPALSTSTSRRLHVLVSSPLRIAASTPICATIFIHAFLQMFCRYLQAY
jgi:hypothetical protein